MIFASQVNLERSPCGLAMVPYDHGSPRLSGTNVSADWPACPKRHVKGELRKT